VPVLKGELLMKGLVHIYTGTGKGKTTAAIGLGIRAYGRGFKVMLVQFLKTMDSGELYTFKKLEPDFVVIRGKGPEKFTWKMTAEEKEEARREQLKLLEKADEALRSGEWDLVIMDEIFGAISAGLVDKEEVIRLVREKPDKPELVLTGRNAPPELIELADYVSDIQAVKHPMEKGVPARKGIED